MLKGTQNRDNKWHMNNTKKKAILKRRRLNHLLHYKTGMPTMNVLKERQQEQYERVSKFRDLSPKNSLWKKIVAFIKSLFKKDVRVN